MTHMHANQQLENSFHQVMDRCMRHPAAILLVIAFVAVAMIHFDTRFSRVVQQAYYQGFGWIGTYMHHEHPMHASWGAAASRLPTTSGAE